MSNLTSRFLRRAVIGGVAVALATAAATGTASAAGSVQIIGGTLAMTAPTVGNFSSVTLNGSNQTTTATTGSFTATDPTGTAAGWHVNVNATQFCTGTVVAGLCTTGNSLAVGSLSHGAPASATAGTGSSAVPSLSAASAVDGGPAVAGKIVSAASGGAGMGSYTIGASTLTVSVPASAYAGTYVSTLTYTIASTP